MVETKELKDVRFGMIGCGNMGEAVLRRLLKAMVTQADRIIVATRTVERQQYLAETYGVQGGTIEEVYAQSTFVILTVKPQQFHDIQAVDLTPDTILLSVMAGVSTRALKEKFQDAMIARAMPNLGFGLGKGVTGLFHAAESDWSAPQTKTLHAVVASGGAVINLEDEMMLDAFTAIAGSGPAYFLWFAEQLIAAAYKLGFDQTQADVIVRQVLIGAASLLNDVHAADVARLRQQVTSKGGTTEAALATFTKGEIGKVIGEAVQAASERSRKLDQS